LQGERGYEAIPRRHAHPQESPLPSRWKRLITVGPSTKELTSKNEVHTGVQNAHQVPQFMNLSLNWVAVPSRRFLVRCPIFNMKSSRLLGSSFFAPRPPRRRALCASSVLPFHTCVRADTCVPPSRENQSGRNNCDAERAARYVFRTARLNGVTLWISPNLLRR